MREYNGIWLNQQQHTISPAATATAAIATTAADGHDQDIKNLTINETVK